MIVSWGVRMEANVEIVSTYHAWRGGGLTQRRGAGKGEYSDGPGFCKSVTAAETAAQSHVPTPGRYVDAVEGEIPLDEKMPRLVAELHAPFAESAKFEQTIKGNLRKLGYGG
jgi:type I restriction enzyme M protein